MRRTDECCFAWTTSQINDADQGGSESSAAAVETAIGQTFSRYQFTTIRNNYTQTGNSLELPSTIRSDAVELFEYRPWHGKKEDVKIRDEDTGELILLVIRDSCSTDAVLKWAVEVIYYPLPNNLSQFNFSCSSVFALMWNMMRNQLPEEVLHGLYSLIIKWDIPVTMDSDEQMDSYYGFQHPNGDYYEFHDC
ncbi:hypothetical protein BDD12DRAFT_805632 [Trichophaea hybrida]|nr:hypothetical protein BDD12DRAFT_805632 [Trichophaea hybrida]